VMLLHVTKQVTLTLTKPTFKLHESQLGVQLVSRCAARLLLIY
jgi:hypothetical protein